MAIMDTSAIRQVITETLNRFDPVNGAAAMTISLTRISKPFGLPDNAHSREQIFGMLLDYIQSVPDDLAGLHVIGQRYHIIALLQPFIDLSTNYLAATCRGLELPPQPMRDEPLDTSPFLALLQGAYIFNRLLEELNDEIQSFIGIPLTGTNTMTANLIVHDVIGDSFANRLDKIIDALIARSAITKSIIEAQLASAHVISLKKESCALSGEKIEDLAGRHNLALF
jgi:AcrR family transcriptional regulator